MLTQQDFIDSMDEEDLLILEALTVAEAARDDAAKALNEADDNDASDEEIGRLYADFHRKEKIENEAWSVLVNRYDGFQTQCLNMMDREKVVEDRRAHPALTLHERIESREHLKFMDPLFQFPAEPKPVRES